MFSDMKLQKLQEGKKSPNRKFRRNKINIFQKFTCIPLCLHEIINEVYICNIWTLWNFPVSLFNFLKSSFQAVLIYKVLIYKVALVSTNFPLSIWESSEKKMLVCSLSKYHLKKTCSNLCILVVVFLIQSEPLLVHNVKIT